MVRKFALTATLYNGGELSMLEFITQCYEMYKDDVLNWDTVDSVKTAERFILYSRRYPGFRGKLFRKIRNEYVHGFDTELRYLYIDMLCVQPTDIKFACEYFGITYEFKYINTSLLRLGGYLPT